MIICLLIQDNKIKMEKLTKKNEDAAHVPTEVIVCTAQHPYLQFRSGHQEEEKEKNWR